MGFSPQNQAAGRVQKGSWEGEIGSRGSKSGFWRSDLGSQTPDLARGGPAEAPGGLERALGGAQGGSGRWTGWEGPRWAYRQPTDAALRDPETGWDPGYTWPLDATLVTTARTGPEALCSTLSTF